jgi:predicted TIM-barrel fold metal-dependent hydrolase
MNKSGIDVAPLYPNLSSFGYEGFYRQVNEEEFQLDSVRAYTDFILEWTSEDPKRFIQLAVIPYWDVAAAEEIHRCASLGHKGLITTAAPHLHDQPYIASHHWDPIWAAAQETSMPISFHADGGDLSAHINKEREGLESATASRAPHDRGIPRQCATAHGPALLGQPLGSFLSLHTTTSIGRPLTPPFLFTSAALASTAS